jgi:hypothetical protein
MSLVSSQTSDNRFNEIARKPGDTGFIYSLVQIRTRGNYSVYRESSLMARFKGLLHGIDFWRQIVAGERQLSPWTHGYSRPQAPRACPLNSQYRCIAGKRIAARSSSRPMTA